MAKRLPSGARVCLVCWNAEEGAVRAATLRDAGLRVTLLTEEIGGWITYFRELAPDVVVIDLGRLPSHGREVGKVLRQSKTTRHLPLVYLGGAAEKVKRLRGELPDATYAAWEDATSVVKGAMAGMRPAQVLGAQGLGRRAPERRRDADLSRRLGIAANMQLVGRGDVELLASLLGELPEGVALDTRIDRGRLSRRILCLCLTRTLAEATGYFDTVTDTFKDAVALWMIFPKQTGRLRTDFNQNDVRAAGLERGWVDCKVCSVDEDWSGLRFARRKMGEGLKARQMRR